MNRSFDRDFWQAQGSNAIFDAAWQMVIDHYQLTGGDPAELEFQPSVEMIHRPVTSPPTHKQSPHHPSPDY